MDIISGALIVFCVAVIGSIVLAIVILKSYNIEVTVYQQMSGYVRTIKKKARKIQNLNENTLRIFMIKKMIPLPAGDYFFQTDKGKLQINLYQDKLGDYHPCRLRFDENHNSFIVPEESSMRFYHTLEKRQNHEKYKNVSGWEKYTPLLIVGSSLAFGVFAMILTFYYYGEWIRGMQSQLGGSMQNLADALRTLGPAPGKLP